MAPHLILVAVGLCNGIGGIKGSEVYLAVGVGYLVDVFCGLGTLDHKSGVTQILKHVIECIMSHGAAEISGIEIDCKTHIVLTFGDHPHAIRKAVAAQQVHKPLTHRICGI